MSLDPAVALKKLQSEHKILVAANKRLSPVWNIESRSKHVAAMEAAGLLPLKDPSYTTVIRKHSVANRAKWFWFKLVRRVRRAIHR